MTEKKDTKWKAGQSGNPKGRPPGSSEVGKLRAAISEHLPEIIAAQVEKAKEGDGMAARLLLERVLPAIKAAEETVRLDLPVGAGLAEQGQAIMRAVAEGVIAPGQGAALLSGLGNMAKLKEIDDLTARIEALEAEAKK